MMLLWYSAGVAADVADVAAPADAADTALRLRAGGGSSRPGHARLELSSSPSSSSAGQAHDQQQQHQHQRLLLNIAASSSILSPAGSDHVPEQQPCCSYPHINEQQPPQQQQGIVHDASAMTFRQRLQVTLQLWPYMVPLFVVYFAEYAMQSGTWTAIGFPVTSADARHRFYLYSNWVYQAGEA
jgi:hypothetical protein